MKVKVKNHDAVSFNEAVGISEERANQLSDKLDELVKSYQSSAVRVVDMINDVGSFCANIEEFTYCLLNHMEYRRFKNLPYICLPQTKNYKP